MKDLAKGLSSKLNLYDHIGYLLVGGIGLMLICFDIFIAEKMGVRIWNNQPTKYIPSFNLNTFVGWFVAAYFLGHIVQAIANIFIRERKAIFNDSEKEILDRARGYFQVKNQDDDQVYLLCYMLACAKDITGHVTAFNAYYSLYRGWLIAFALETVYIGGLLIVYWNHWTRLVHIVYLVISIIIIILFRRRATRFHQYSRAKTLQTFIILERTGND